MMISIAESFDNVSDLEYILKGKYEKWLILGSNHPVINECYLLESDSNELNFGLGIAVTGTGIMPKILLVENYQTVYIGFDSYIAAVSTIRPSSTIESRLSELDWIFFDMFLLKNGNICVIHEIGAQVFMRDLTKVWSFSKDIVSNWVISEEQGRLSLTQMDTEEIINLSISTGAILAA
ncbi:hypothetical protein KMZ15_06680 [Mycoavidus sp. HKI]|uniref:hypothetical protein n=1 Tax=Mycoavidus sp. HKI TaxID=2840467 RepID=UPI001CBD4720|nr:hypothetical protein [Mycoavidus sp. HKI]UAW63750.1 hypothetical protein KMZ15_06680 [Mycoavidus sp. HKI]